MICVDVQPDTGYLVSAVCNDANYRVLTQAEINQISASPWALTVPQGAAVGMAILAVWAIAFGWKAIAAALKHGNSPD